MVASGESSMNSQAPWLRAAALLPLAAPPQKSVSYSDLVSRRGTLEDVMQEFRMNGFDAPYNPDDERQPDGLPTLRGQSTGRALQRFWSWPPTTESSRGWQPRADAPEFRPACPSETTGKMSIGGMSAKVVSPSPSEGRAQVTPEQLAALRSLPTDALRALLRELEQRRGDQGSKMCRFCKNNGERELYYRSHELRDAAGRVACPVLRAYRCARCGAQGDNAHTIKYCPYTTTDERITSAAMMRSVRLAAQRRRARAGGDRVRGVAGPAPHELDKLAYNTYAEAAPLDPLWQALEQKLML